MRKGREMKRMNAKRRESSKEEKRTAKTMAKTIW
jgi:hypothetical protein